MKIAPSLLNADFGALGEAARQAERGGADWLHLDVMDGRFVPNMTFGPAMVEAIRRVTHLPLDIHLMVEEPGRWVRAFRAAGGDSLTIHLEADRHAHRTLGEIRSLGARAGLALNPGTPISAAEDLLDAVDLLLVMSVNPGAGGQPFIPRSLAKVSTARALLDAHSCAADLEVDGGVRPDNAAALARAGASVLVAGSFVYAGGDVAENLASLRRAVSPVA